MELIFADKESYVNTYLLGREPVLSLDEFGFWEKKARKWINYYTFDRIDSYQFEKHSTDIGECVCELAEHLYMNEGSENKESESVRGRSVKYRENVVYEICRKHLAHTGLMFVGVEAV